MKKNAFLFLILIFLLTFTYLYQEKGIWSKKLKSQTTLLKMEDLDSISLKDGVINLKPTPIIENLKFPADKLAITRFLNMLQAVFLKKEIQFDEKLYKNYFPADAPRIKLRTNNLTEIEFILGDTVPGTEDFYWLEKKENMTKLFVASFEEALKTGETQYYHPGDKYKHLFQMLDLSSETFFLSHIISPTEFNQLSSIQFSFKDLPVFEIPFTDEKRIHFKPDYNLNWNYERIELLKESLKNLKGSGIARSVVGSEMILDLNIKFTHSQNIRLRVHQKKDSGSFYIQRDESTNWYSLSPGTLDFLMNPKEEYWFKKINLGQKDLTSVGVTLKQLNRSIFIQNFSATPAPLDELLNLLFSKSPWLQADRISPLTKKAVFLDNKGLEIKIDRLNLFITQKNDEIIIANNTDGYVLHYYLTKERMNHKISLNLDEYKK